MQTKGKSGPRTGSQEAVVFLIDSLLTRPMVHRTSLFLSTSSFDPSHSPVSQEGQDSPFPGQPMAMALGFLFIFSHYLNICNFCPHFTDEQTEAKESYINCLRGTARTPNEPK